MSCNALVFHRGFYRTESSNKDVSDYVVLCFDRTQNNTPKAKVRGRYSPSHSQEHSLCFSPRFVNLNVTELLIG